MHDLLNGAAYRHEVHHVVRLVAEHMQLVHEYAANLVCTDLVLFVDGVHDILRFFAHPGKGEKAV